MESHIARLLVFGSVAVILSCALLAGTCRGDDLEDCIAATCRVKSGDGGVGTGFLYAVGPEAAGGEDLAWIGTAGHVIVGDRLSCEFGRARVRVEVRPYWRNRGVDAGVLVVPWRAFPAPRPRPIPIAPPRIRIQIGQALFSVGCPGGGDLMLWRGECKGYFGSAMTFWPGPELGRSGSPIFCYLAAGQPAVVGIVSARDGGSLTSGTRGMAVSVQQLRGDVSTAYPQGWRPTQYTQGAPCPGGQCPQAAPGGSSPFGERFYIDPYRNQQKKRNDYLYQQIQGGERSQGTLPLPPQQEAPRIDLTPLEQRVSRLELESDQAAKERAELTRRADLVRDTAKELAEKYEKQLPGISGDVKAAIDASTAAAAAAKTAATVAETAKVEATTAKQELKEAVDEENPKGIVGKLKARIEEAKAAGAEGKGEIAKMVLAGLWDSYKLPVGLGGLVLGFFLWDLRKKVTTGDPLLVEKVANRVHERIGPIRERIVERVKDRLHPDPDSDPTQPQ